MRAATRTVRPLEQATTLHETARMEEPATSDPRTPANRQAGEWSRKLVGSLPLIVLAGAMLATAVAMAILRITLGAIHFPLWPLFAGMGLISAGGAVILPQPDSGSPSPIPGTRTPTRPDVPERPEFGRVEPIAHASHADAVPVVKPTPTLGRPAPAPYPLFAGTGAHSPPSVRETRPTVHSAAVKAFDKSPAVPPSLDADAVRRPETSSPASDRAPTPTTELRPATAAALKRLLAESRKSKLDVPVTFPATPAPRTASPADFAVQGVPTPNAEPVHPVGPTPTGPIAHTGTPLPTEALTRAPMPPKAIPAIGAVPMPTPTASTSATQMPTSIASPAEVPTPAGAPAPPVTAVSTLTPTQTPPAALWSPDPKPVMSPIAPMSGAPEKTGTTAQVDPSPPSQDPDPRSAAARPMAHLPWHAAGPRPTTDRTFEAGSSSPVPPVDPATRGSDGIGGSSAPPAMDHSKEDPSTNSKAPPARSNLAVRSVGFDVLARQFQATEGIRPELATPATRPSPDRVPKAALESAPVVAPTSAVLPESAPPRPHAADLHAASADPRPPDHPSSAIPPTPSRELPAGFVQHPPVSPSATVPRPEPHVVLCVRCHRRLGNASALLSCLGCGRPFCTDCFERIVGTGGSLLCPDCIALGRAGK